MSLSSGVPDVTERGFKGVRFGASVCKHRSPETVEKMAVRYRRDAGLHWSATLAGIERVKRLYQAAPRASGEEDG
ncbi:TPA: hypothetical protein PAP86_004427 [Salmonella enterica]|nr:hypothetical protein [Salmonella enterica]